ncbi:MAG: regulatory protein RecX [Gaiellaceae bacterium]
MPAITGLREGRRGSVAIELDGEPWRTLPVDVVVRAGLALGGELDRPRLRDLGRELRRTKALSRATRALAVRDLSRRSLDERLRQAGVAQRERSEALDTLARAGLVDDERFACGRAHALSDRGFGDAAIRWHLEREGVDAGLVERALAELEPERERAERIAENRGRTAATARFLARKGFADDAVEAVVGADAGAGA